MKCSITRKPQYLVYSMYFLEINLAQQIIIHCYLILKRYFRRAITCVGHPWSRINLCWYLSKDLQGAVHFFGQRHIQTSLMVDAIVLIIVILIRTFPKPHQTFSKERCISSGQSCIRYNMILTLPHWIIEKCLIAMVLSDTESRSHPWCAAVICYALSARWTSCFYRCLVTVMIDLACSKFQNSIIMLEDFFLFPHNQKVKTFVGLLCFGIR